MSLSWERLNALIEACGGAAYVARNEVLAGNVGELRRAFEARYPRVALGYSYKTNYLRSFCLEAHRLGLYAEVVSGVEYQLARSFGVPPDRILFNGPAKRERELERALAEGATINVDHLDEVAAIERIVARLPGLAGRVGLRCDLDLHWRDRVSRFGLNAATGELAEAAGRLRLLRGIEVAGLHCHFSWSRTAAAFGDRTAALLATARELFGPKPPRFLDVGGGFCGPMPGALASQLGFAVPSFDDYAKAVALPVAEFYGVDEGPELILEPGVGLVGDCMDYVCQVVAVKAKPGRRVVVTTGALQHLKIVPSSINLPMSVVASPSATRPPAAGCPSDVTGFTCLEHDVLQRDCDEDLAPGDILVFGNVGGYSLASAPWFIEPAPPVVEFVANGSWRTLMRSRRLDDLLDQFAGVGSERGTTPLSAVPHEERE